MTLCYKLELCDFVFIPETCHGSEAVGDLLSFDVFTKVRTDLFDLRGRCNIGISFRLDMEYSAATETDMEQGVKICFLTDRIKLSAICTGIGDYHI